MSFTAGHDDLVEAAGHPVGAGEGRPGYDPRRAGHALPAPAAEATL